MLFAVILHSTASLEAQATAPPPLLLGTSWYPEQWPESRWDADLTLMQQAGIRVVRVAEFSWGKMEPSEGQYDFGWLDRVIDAAAKHNIVVVLGTPSMAPPAWLTQKYPEVLRVDEDGHRAEHGTRQQFCFASPKYRELARGIAEQMALRYGHNRNVIGWQIDDEYRFPSFDAETKDQFHEWLKARYGTLDNLNKHWNATFWDQTYTDWNQVPISSETYHVETGKGNPGLLLSWKRFVSDEWRSYQKNQVDVLRANIDPRQFITTSLMNWFNGFDHYVITEDLDLAAWDVYTDESAHLDPIHVGAGHDLTRGFKRKNYWTMETEPGVIYWKPINNAMDRGEVRAGAWLAVGHGSDAVLYWQWRAGLNGEEIYHGTIVGPDGEPQPIYPEIQQIGREFAKAGPALAGTSVDAEIAIVQSYDSRWAIEMQPQHRDYDPVAELLSFYEPLRRSGQPVDIVSPEAPLGKYKLVVAPSLMILSDAIAKNLRDYVEHGGHLVLGPRSGFRDEDCALQPQRQPGPLADLLGGRVEQYYALEKPVAVEGTLGDGEAKIWAEWLHPSAGDVEVLERYGKANTWLDGQPAAITRKVGNGRITYIGAWLDKPVAEEAARWILDTSGVKPVLPGLPEGVELDVRRSENQFVYVLINFSQTEQAVALPSAMTDVLEGGKKQKVTLPKYGVAVLSSAVPK
ncbi:MAG: beta-galactosidase [Terracidiphilus sp.]